MDLIIYIFGMIITGIAFSVIWQLKEYEEDLVLLVVVAVVLWPVTYALCLIIICLWFIFQGINRIAKWLIDFWGDFINHLPDITIKRKE